MHQNSEEILPVVNENGEVTGKASRDRFHFNPKEKLLHPVVHLHLLNMSGQLFLQYRPKHKEVQPGKWDTAVGGHVSYGETVMLSLERESNEEIGINPEGAELITRYIWETEIERELVYLFLLRTHQIPVINSYELGGGRFWDCSEIDENLDKDIFTPNFVHEYRMLRGRGVMGIMG